MITSLTEKEVKIRKHHHCHGCFRKFEKGTKMIYWSCVDGSDFSHGYTCRTCNQITKYENKHHRQDWLDGFPEGWVSDSLDINETPEQLLKRYEKEYT